MAEKLWEDVKKGLKDTVNFVTEKTEELTSIGKLKIDIAGLKRKKDKKFKELGNLVYTKLEKEEGLVLDSDDAVKTITAEIESLGKELNEKEKELDGIGSKKNTEQNEPTAEMEESKSKKK